MNGRNGPILIAELPPGSQGRGLIFGTADAGCTLRRWASWRSHITSLLSAVASKQYQEQTESLQKALLPEAYRPGHDMSRTGEPYLKTGERARSDTRRAVIARQQNRRVLLPFGPTSSCYRVEQRVNGKTDPRATPRTMCSVTEGEVDKPIPITATSRRM